MSADEGATTGGFVGRWASRKRNTALGTESGSVQHGPGAPDPMVGKAIQPDRVEPLVPTEPPQVADVTQQQEAQAPFEPVLGDADMPPIQSLDASSDLSGFFSSGVSATLRRAALRHVFRSPRYNERDGLNDYDGDFTAFEPLGDTVTADMKFHALREERKAQERKDAEREVRDVAREDAELLDSPGAGDADQAETDVGSGTPDLERDADPDSISGADPDPAPVTPATAPPVPPIGRTPA